MRFPVRSLESMPLLVVLVVLPFVVVIWAIRGLVAGITWSSRRVGGWISGATVQARARRERLGSP
jgi:hypothetical protein